MDEIIKLTLELPSISLSQDEWRIVRSILCHFEVDTPQKFKNQVISQKQPFNTKRLERFTNYLPTLFKIYHEFMAWQQKVIATWQHQFNNRPPGQDELLPIMMHFLTLDKGTLVKALRKLEILFNTDDTSARAFVFSSLASAVSAKIQEIEKPVPVAERSAARLKLETKITLLEKEIKHADLEIKRQMQVQELHKRCFEYQAYLQNLIQLKLFAVNIELYKAKFGDAEPNSKNPARDYSFKIIEIANLVGNNGHGINQHADLILLLDKFKAIFDLCQTCSRKGINSTDKLIEFGQKYQVHQETLDKDGDIIGIKILKSITGYLVFEQLFSLINPSSADSFARTAGVFSSSVRSNTASTVLDRINPVRIFQRK